MKRFVIATLACTLSAAMALAGDAVEYPIRQLGDQCVYVYPVEKSIGLYRISKNFDVTQDTIQALNPILRERQPQLGDTLFIPVVGENCRACIPVEEEEVAEDTTPVIDTTCYRIGVLLPFHRGGKAPNINAQRITDFYRGVLMAIYHIQKAEQTRFDVQVYNCDKDTVRISQLIADNSLDSLHGLIGPYYTEQIQYMSPWILAHQLPTIIPTATDSVYLKDNPYIMQFNTSLTQETKAIIDYILDWDGKTRCIFLNDTAIAADERIVAIQQAMRLNEIPYEVITKDELMKGKLNTLLMAETEHFVFLNSTTYKPNRSIIKYLSAQKYPRICLYGSYSWQKFYDEFKLPMIYTTAFTTDSEADLSTYDADWDYYFGFGHPSTLPRYDLLGYDLTRKLITTIQNRNQSKGLQSDIFFVPYTEGGGQVNGHIEVLRLE